MTAPIELMLDVVEWEALPPMAGEGDGIPHATHQGVLHIGEYALKCFQLSDGARIFDADDLARFFGFENHQQFAQLFGGGGQ